MDANFGFWVGFGRWLARRYADLPVALKDDFVLDLIAVFAVLAPAIEAFPKQRTLRTLFQWVAGFADPLAPVRAKIRQMQTKWGQTT